MTQFSVGPFEPIAPGVFVAVAEPAAVTIGVIVGETGAVVIDTGSSPAQGAEIRAAAEAVAGVPLTAVVVTHAHYDHFFGLAGFAGIASYGHESLPEAVAGEVVAEAAAELGLDVSELTVPDQLFSLARVIDLGGRRVEVLHFGPAHTDGDVVVYVPDADVIFAGDLLESAGPPSFGADSRIKDWPSALDGVLGLVGERTVLVPGHGPVMDRIAAFEQRAAIAGFYAEVADLAARGVAAEAAYEAATWAFDEATVRAALPMLYAELAPTGVTAKRQLPLLGG